MFEDHPQNYHSFLFDTQVLIIEILLKFILENRNVAMAGKGKKCSSYVVYNLIMPITLQFQSQEFTTPKNSMA